MVSSAAQRDFTSLAEAVGVYKPARTPRCRIDWLDYPRRVEPRPESSAVSDVVLGVLLGTMLWAPPLLWMAEVI